jgi:hypothetical protein
MKKSPDYSGLFYLIGVITTAGTYRPAWIRRPALIRR